MRQMTRYELKKVFFRTGNKIALFVLLAMTGIVCFFACSVPYTDADGVTRGGPWAVASLRADQKKWEGILDEDRIRQVIAENKRITDSPEYLSEDVTKNNIAYSWGQGIMEIRELLNRAFAEGFRDYNYYRANGLEEADAPQFYGNRIMLLEEWLRDEAADTFSEEEKAYLIHQYESLETPLYYDYMKGWSQLFEFAPTIVMITMLVLGYLVSGIFSGEFTCKSDGIFFTSLYGRNRAVLAKIKAGFLIVTIIYFAVMLVYTGITVGYLGAGGWKCPIQINQWKSLYNITVGQEYLLILAGGYMGCLFISFLCMLVSAKAKSAVTAVVIPFVLIFIPSFIANINNPLVNKILGLLPDQLLQVGVALNYFMLYTVNGKVFSAVPVLLTLYPALTLAFIPGIYYTYRRRQII